MTNTILTKAPAWCKDAIPTAQGWKHPITGELLVAVRGIKVIDENQSESVINENIDSENIINENIVEKTIIAENEPVKAVISEKTKNKKK